jgi:quercetin dioxygenase-like cupin family protein
MMSEIRPDGISQQTASLPADNLRRKLTVANADNPALSHLGIVGDTYTILLSGEDTAGRFCLVDMHVPPGGGPPPHRHDFEETFSLLQGELEFTFRGQKSVLRTGDTVNIPANAPHQFRNASDKPARMLCICAPAGQEGLFRAVGVPVAGRTTPPPPPDAAAMAAFKAKTESLVPKYKTEILDHA